MLWNSGGDGVPYGFPGGVLVVDFSLGQAYKNPVTVLNTLIMDIGQNCLKTPLILHYQGKMTR
jgi:hypothetical protein